MSDQSGEIEALLRRLLTEALPYVDFDARYWNENASEEQNRRRMAEAGSFGDRIRAALSGSDESGGAK